MPNNQRQHRTSHAPKGVLPVRICANYCAPCQEEEEGEGEVLPGSSPSKTQEVGAEEGVGCRV